MAILNCLTWRHVSFLFFFLDENHPTRRNQCLHVRQHRHKLDLVYFTLLPV